MAICGWVKTADGHEAVIAADHRVGMGEVVADDAHLVVGDVLELPRRGDVAEREDPVDRRLLELVDDDEPVSGSTSIPEPATSSRSLLGTRPVATSTMSAVTWRPATSTSTLGARGSERRRLRAAEQRPAPPGRVRERLGDVVVVPASSRSPRITWVTSQPKASNTWANSAAMNPPPKTITDRGSSSSRMIVSDVWTRGPSSSPAIAGTVARLPAAMTQRSAVTTVPVPVSSRLCPTNREPSPCTP